MIKTIARLNKEINELKTDNKALRIRLDNAYKLLDGLESECARHLKKIEGMKNK